LFFLIYLFLLLCAPQSLYKSI